MNLSCHKKGGPVTQVALEAFETHAHISRALITLRNSAPRPAPALMIHRWRAMRSLLATLMIHRRRTLVLIHRRTVRPWLTAALHGRGKIRPAMLRRTWACARAWATLATVRRRVHGLVKHRLFHERLRAVSPVLSWVLRPHGLRARTTMLRLLSKTRPSAARSGPACALGFPIITWAGKRLRCLLAAKLPPKSTPSKSTAHPACGTALHVPPALPALRRTKSSPALRSRE